ncbi:MAG: DUF58 domain-containing protein [Phycisphaerae bacterium]|nr:DUF58 domain-containing protein [Phycisphaerae bacterium]
MLTEELMREVRRLRVGTRRRVDDLFAGEYQSAFKGQGIEFAEVREYEPGDDVRSIDWNVTARTGKTFVKRFVEERQLTVVYTMDVSASTAFGSVGQTTGRLLAEVGATLCLAAQNRRDRVGLARFSDSVESFVPPGRGPRHLMRIMRDLISSEPAGQGLAMGETLERLRRVLRRHAVVFVASDWLLPDDAAHAERVESAIKLLRRRHEVVAIRATDPRTLRMPNVGLIELRDAETGARRLIDTASRDVRERHDRRAAEQRASVETMLRRSGVDLVDVRPDQPFINDLLRYFRLRERRR